MHAPNLGQNSRNPLPLNSGVGPTADAFRQMHLELWAQRDSVIAGEAAIANLEWRLQRYALTQDALDQANEYIRGLLEQQTTWYETEKRLNEELSLLQHEIEKCRRSWSFRIGKLVLLPLKPLKMLFRALRKSHHES
jgi:hypothetical protein